MTMESLISITVSTPPIRVATKLSLPYINSFNVNWRKRWNERDPTLPDDNNNHVRSRPMLPNLILRPLHISLRHSRKKSNPLFQPRKKRSSLHLPYPRSRNHEHSDNPSFDESQVIIQTTLSQKRMGPDLISRPKYLPQCRSRK